ncbi:MAG: hypothetical protein ACXVSX_09230 [Solirubrobacteraceae bacterium]
MNDGPTDRDHEPRDPAGADSSETPPEQGLGEPGGAPGPGSRKRPDTPASEPRESKAPRTRPAGTKPPDAEAAAGTQPAEPKGKGEEPVEHALPDRPERPPAPRRGAGLTAGEILLSWPVLVGAIAAVLAVVCIAIALILISGENHYRNCVYSVQVRLGDRHNPLDRLGRAAEVKRCSRSPF